MSVDSVAVIAAISLIIFFAKESLARGRRYGSMGFGANVHDDADMDYESVVGPFSVVANAHLYRYAHIGAHVHIDDDVSVHRKGIVMNHTRIQSGAIIGNRTVCGLYSLIEKNAIIGDYAILEEESTVMSHGEIGRHGIVGPGASIGRRTKMAKYACVADRARVGADVNLGPYTVVQGSVKIPAGLKVSANTIVITPPQTTALFHRLLGRTFSKRFQRELDKLTAKSDRSFLRDFSKRLGDLLNDLYEDCENITDFEPNVLFLLYSYLQKMHGVKRFNMNKKPTEDILVLNGKILVADDCQNARHYDKYFDVKTKEMLLMMMAIFDDFNRQSRIKGETFCSIVNDLLNKKRSVLVINTKCGGTATVQCNDCGKGDGIPRMGKYFMHKSDIFQE